MSNNNNLHNKVHWRRIRNIYSALSNLESVNMNNYNFNSICCYQCTGVELHGKNVKFQTNGRKIMFC